MRAPLTHREIAKFFLPLIFVTELLYISHSIIHAFLARLPRPTVTLAGYNAAFSVVSTLASPSSSTTSVSLAFMRDRASARTLLLFFVLMLTPPMVLVLVVGVSPLGDWVYGGLLGASPEVVVQAKRSTLLLMLYVPSVVIRFMATAIIMINRRTILTTYGTAIRLSSLWGFLVVLPHYLEGAAVGGAALTLGMWVEMVFTAALAVPYYRRLPARVPETATLRGIWRFSWPFLINQLSENGLLLWINVFMGRLAKPDLALAAYGVVHGLSKLILSPVRNLLQTAQTLVHTREEQRLVLDFTFRVAMTFSAIVIVLFYTPLRYWIMEGVMGLSPLLAAETRPAMMLALFVVLCWTYSAVFRGLLSGQGRTGAFAVTAGLRLTMIALVGSLGLFLPHINGAVLGMIALASAFGGEAYMLGYRLFLVPPRRRDRTGDSPAEPPFA